MYIAVAEGCNNDNEGYPKLRFHHLVLPKEETVNYDGGFNYPKIHSAAHTSIINPVTPNGQ